MAPIRSAVFIGNPGVGKSTLLNCILQEKPHFSSGLSVGEGKTKWLQEYHNVKDGITYIDTPGLSDVKIRKQAAEEIKKALEPVGNVKRQCQVFFVITLEAGRIRPDDKVTINLVLEAAESIGSYYSIIINKLPKPTYEKLSASEEMRLALRTGLLEGLKFPTANIYFAKKDAALDDEDDVLVELDPILRQFIEQARPVEIDSVKSIDVQDFEKLFEKLSAQMEELKNDRDLLLRRLAEQDVMYKKLVEEQEKYLEENKDKKPGFMQAVGVALRPWKWFG